MAIGFKIKNKSTFRGPIQAIGGLQLGANGTNLSRMQTGVLNFVAGTIAVGTVTVINSTEISGFGTADKIFGMGPTATFQNGVGFGGFRAVGPGTVGAEFRMPGTAAGTVNGTISVPYLWLQA